MMRKEIEVAESIQCIKEQLLEGITLIRSLCDEAEEEIKANEAISPRLTDILAEAIPELSEKLFDVIIDRGHISSVDCNKDMAMDTTGKRVLKEELEDAVKESGYLVTFQLSEEAGRKVCDMCKDELEEDDEVEAVKLRLSIKSFMTSETKLKVIIGALSKLGKEVQSVTFESLVEE